MYVLNCQNVNDAYYSGLSYLIEYGVRSPSRAGDVLVAPTPVTTVYNSPCERVLFDEARDANPFFHLFEGLWMLSGSNDARWLDQFVKDFSSRFAEEGGVQHGAYGHRWRSALGFDQLKIIVDKLKASPEDRQCVLQMWDTTPSDYVLNPNSPEKELLGHDDLRGNWKDRPCNTHAYFRLRNSRENINGNWVDVKRLDMTVCCRSNDIIWGAYGANAVHFSMLLEYMAAMLGVHVGRYYQVSNNFHGYLAELGKVTHTFPGAAQRVSAKPNPFPYEEHGLESISMVTAPEDFDDDLAAFMEWVGDQRRVAAYANPWFVRIAHPMFAAAQLWRGGSRSAAQDCIKAMPLNSDWGRAAWLWMERRLARAKAKEVM